MDAPDNAVVGIEEMTVHGWDLAAATSQDLRADDARLGQVDRFFELFAEPIAAGEGPFGPAVSPPEVQHGSSGPSHARAVIRRGKRPLTPPSRLGSAGVHG